MIKIAITGSVDDRGREFTVWVMLDDSMADDDPRRRSESFVIGEGADLRTALTAAREDLQRALGYVEVLLHDVDHAPGVSLEDLVR